jgi:hypothetical protein
MTVQDNPVSQGMYCATVAASGVITAWSDIRERGYLKKHPACVAYQLDLLEQVIAVVRAQVRAEGIKWRREEVANGWTPPDPDAEHHQEVAEYLDHHGCCPRCLVCQGHAPDTPDPDPWASDPPDGDWDPVPGGAPS